MAQEGGIDRPGEPEDPHYREPEPHAEFPLDNPPPHPPVVPGEIGEPRTSDDDPMETYHTAAETIGFVPSLRGKDNLLQLVAIVVCVALGVAIGIAVAITAQGLPWYGGALIGALGGLVVGALGSGLVLMVLGWVRTAKKINGRKN